MPTFFAGCLIVLLGALVAPVAAAGDQMPLNMDENGVRDLPTKPQPPKLPPSPPPPEEADPETLGLDRGAYPWFRVQQQFPREALEQGVSGCVIYGFTITETGAAGDILVIDSSNPIFDPYGISALEQYRYIRVTMNGIPVSTPNQTIRLVWELAGEPLPGHPACQ